MQYYSQNREWSSFCPFWRDKWCSEISLANLFPNLFDLALDKIITVRQAGGFGAAGWRWRIQFRRKLIGSEDYKELVSKVNQ